MSAENVRILVVDDEESLRHMLSLALSKEGYAVWTASSGDEALQVLSTKERFDICLTDVRMPGMDGLTFVEKAARLPKSPTLLAMSAYGDDALAMEALRRGAFDYLKKPFEPADLVLKLRLVGERERLRRDQTPQPTEGSSPSRRASHSGSATPSGLASIISRDVSMHRVFETVRKVASFPTTVLLTGETGTGKERIAGAIHAEGKRSGRPFVAINCGAIPENLLESELFGHVRGAFTDASTDKAGLFEVADGGTLFLDEVADMPLSLQVKLLRALVEREVRPVGGTRSTPVDVRVIAATSTDLKTSVEQGLFREDLYYRLAVVHVQLPPLRSRRSDIPVLVHHFMDRIARRLSVAVPHISEEAMEALRNYEWPGNVRELENAIERAIVLSEGENRLTMADLDERFDPIHHADEPTLMWISRLDDISVKSVLPVVERALIRTALERTSGSRSKAADVLGISQRGLLYKLKEYGIK